MPRTLGQIVPFFHHDLKPNTAGHHPSDQGLESVQGTNTTAWTNLMFSSIGPPPGEREEGV